MAEHIRQRIIFTCGIYDNPYYKVENNYEDQITITKFKRGNTSPSFTHDGETNWNGYEITPMEKVTVTREEATRLLIALQKILF
jgi:hypothetical protein